VLAARWQSLQDVGCRAGEEHFLGGSSLGNRALRVSRTSI
jgi:hypothetical protein